MLYVSDIERNAIIRAPIFRLGPLFYSLRAGQVYFSMISLQHITLQRGTKVLLDQASVAINPGEKVALVGRNGAGKSSLFGLLNGTLHEDAGEVAVPSQWRMAQVAQDMPETDATATAFVLGGDTRLLEAQHALDAAEASGDGMAMAHAHTALADAGAHDATARAQALVLGLGFQVNELNKPVHSFSGGWRMRLQLARALMCPSDLLLLDEPTNHLDLDALVWLEGWLKRYAGTLIVISHDREFLDAVTHVTLHIDNAKITRYGGNYSAFETLRAQQITLQQASFARQQDKIAHLQKFIDRFKAKASKAKQAQSRVKALERMERIAPILTSADFDFEFLEPPQLPNPMLGIRDASFGYRGAADESSAAPVTLAELGELGAFSTSDVLHRHQVHSGEALPPITAADTVILQGVSRSVLAGQRIGILGANGQGKSTFIKTVAGTQPLLAGHMTQGKGLRIGYFAQQELDVLRPDENPLQHMVRLARDNPDVAAKAGREQDLRNFLGSFQFSGDMVMQAVGSMSGGEKARLVLAMIVWQRPNLLLLDEPTNHLDLTTREALAMALNGFEGTVMLVSHDRALLRSVCDEFWLVGGGGVAPFEGDLDDYQRYLLDLAKQKRESLQNAAAPASAEKTPATQPAAPALSGAQLRKQQAEQRQQRHNQRRPLQKQLQQYEADMGRLSAQKTELETRLCQPLAAAELADAGRQLKSVQVALDEAENRWLEVSAALEAMDQDAVQGQ